MKSRVKLLNFEFGTIKLDGKNATYTISKNEFSYSLINEIRGQIEKNNLDKFLKLKEVFEDGETVKFVYETIEEMHSLMFIRNEEYIVKLSIAKAILTDNIVDIEEDYVSLHPATIFYHPMSLVKYTYRANSFMPHTKSDNLKRYKALIISILTGFTFERCLNNQNEIESKANELIKSLYRAENIQQLQNLVENACDFVTYQYIDSNSKRLKKVKRNLIAGCIAITLVMTGALGLVKSNASEQQQQAVKQVEAKYQKSQLKLEAENLFNKKEYPKAIEMFIESGTDKEELAKKLLLVEQYNTALSVNPKSLDQVIDMLYQKKQTDKILELKLEDTDKKLKSKLDLEKAIIAYNTEEMQVLLPFTSDKKTLNHMGEAYIAHNDLTSAEEVYNKTQDKNLKAKIDYKKIENELVKAKNELANIKKMKKGKSKSKKLKLQNEKIYEMEAKIQKLKEVIK